jgi:hypothetical protein
MLTDALESPGVQRMLAEALDSPATERLLAEALDSPGMQRLVDRALESRLTDELLTRILEDVTVRLAASQGLWTLIDEVAASPAITEAITQHGVGFADQVADEVRGRTRNADAWMENVARRVLRRRARTPTVESG